MVVITIRPKFFTQAVDDAIAVGARALVVITSGLGEKDEAGLQAQQAAVERCRMAGLVMVGPNCLGIADLTTDLDLTWGDFKRGELALISQSGNIGLELGQLAPAVGVGFSRFVSLGNQADLNAAEAIEDLITHEGTRVIAAYIEDFEDGRHFAAIAARARAAGKPVILLTVGSTNASRRMAHSHTGAIVSDSLAVDAACRDSGIYRVETPLQMIDLAQVLLMPSGLTGGRASILGDGGGHVALAADRLVAHGLQVQRFSEAISRQLAETLPPTATTQNPVDIAGGGEEDIWGFERAARIMAESGETDAVILTGYFGGYSEEQGAWAAEETEVAVAMAKATHAAGVPLIVQTMYPQSPTSQRFRELGVPVYADIDALARALGKLVSLPSAAGSLPVVGRVREGEDLPSVAGSLPLVGRVREGEDLPSAAGSLPLVGRVREGEDVPYFSVRKLLADAGIPFAEAQPARNEKDAVAIANRIGYPVVLKALGNTHKSDLGGVRLAIANDETLRAALNEMQARLRPPLFSVEREAPIERGIELLVGIKRDRSFGPIALVGLGGIHAEIFQDVAVALAPVTLEQASDLIRSLHGSELLTGWRGRPALDLAAAADALRILSQVGAAAPEIHEIEINPLLVLQEGVQALDARIHQWETGASSV